MLYDIMYLLDTISIKKNAKDMDVKTLLQMLFGL